MHQLPVAVAGHPAAGKTPVTYKYLDALLVRGPAWDAHNLGLSWPDLAGPDATITSWRAWLDRVWQLPEVADAVASASPDLARQVARISAGGDIPEAGVRRAVQATLRYLLRGTSRATPFGLLAALPRETAGLARSCCASK